ncbi:MSMEG_1061 family FMN-dependent PPOX-type flavoprotein [Streptosporangium carneum]|uniref:Phosphohydrolase n=1 Tax=Streptosporangium carneum TaxID=47481 RepID=A0A9W6I7R8_9ACTN|nr:MSMEG_1061 family FMN-dependent PPOX-type flavoprotein [Streptosporangium carneum]GLK13188.1 phosphohydrolase [Streptosporangium carneum]
MAVEPEAITEITSEAELMELVGPPNPVVFGKSTPVLRDVERQWLRHSPFCLIATSAADGTCDISPKGDPPGFALVLSDSTIAIPDRPGNRRIDSWRNVLSNPHVGLIFIIPGRGDTLRINGHARLVREAPFFDRMVVKNSRPRIALMVETEEVYFHCSKSFLRAEFWQPGSWTPDAVPSRARIAQATEWTEESLENLERRYGPQYERRLYE